MSRRRNDQHRDSGLTLHDRLRDRSSMAHYAAVEEALGAGEEGEAALADLLATGSADRLLYATAALGDARGDAGPDALRAVLRRPDASRDTQCAALLALVKRCGPSACPELAEGLRSRIGEVKNYAMLGLAAVGDDRAWDQALDRLRQIVRKADRPIYGTPTPFQCAVCYLARHAGSAGSERTVKLAGVLRGSWARLQPEERVWIRTVWPSSDPDGPPLDEVEPPDAETLLEWFRQLPLFGPAF